MKIDNKLLISILLPVGDSQFLEKTLLDIVNQDYLTWELIALLNKSDQIAVDLLKRIIPSEKLILLEFSKPFNLAERLNIAIDHSHGNFIARMDADDRYDSTRFSTQIGHFLKEENSRVAVLGTWATVINEKSLIAGEIQLPTDTDAVRRRFMYRNTVLHPSAMIRRSVLEEFRYNEKTVLCQDLELWLRILKKYEIKNIDLNLLKYRIHFGNQSNNRLSLREILLISKHRWNLVGNNQVLLLHFLIGNSIWSIKNFFIGPLGLQKSRLFLKRFSKKNLV